ncbi:MAG TPA: type VI secretion system TssO [Chitinophagaceae bacterium]|mgnify:CR=1 FL=1|nr:type VI secretion system TssO [Chitinophagaceae bacterium]
MQAFNKAQVVKKTIQFWIIFLILVIYTHIAIYFFIWSAEKHNAVFNEALNNYKHILNKQIMLNNKIDSLYMQMSYLGTDKINNQVFLEKYVADNKNDINKLIDKDSAANFSVYARITKNLNTMLFLKDSIIKVSDQEAFMKNDLLKCIEDNKKVKADIFAKTRMSPAQQ